MASVKQQVQAQLGKAQAAPALAQTAPTPANQDLYSAHIEELGNALGLDIGIQTELKTKLNTFNDSEKYKIMDKTNGLVTKLKEADTALKSLFENTEFKSYKIAIESNLINMNKELLELQILSLIQKKGDCTQVINGLLGALNTKIAGVNEILKANLNQAGGTNNDIYMNKYLKYKNKYLSLKKNINF